jgi:ABC-type bacteriocin/lantibiotic exporter with double-glycine peptidase domain
MEIEGFWPFLAQVFVASLLFQVGGLVIPLFTKILIYYVVLGSINSVLFVVGVSATLAVLSQTTMSYLRSVVLVHFRARIDVQLMTVFVRHLLSLPVSYFLRRTSGDLLVRLSSNAVLRELVAAQVISAILDGGFVTVYAVILFKASPAMGGVVAVVTVLQAAIIVGSRRRIADLIQRDFQARSQEQGYLVDVLRAIVTVKGSGAEGRVYERWRSFFNGQVNVGIERGVLGAAMESAVLFLRSICQVALLWIGVAKVIEQRAELGTVLACTSLASTLYVPIAALISSVQQLQIAVAYFQRVADVLEATPEENAGPNTTTPKFSGTVELRNVGFRYTRLSRPVLSGISCRIDAGQKIAIVGGTGSGKSTLAMLLLGLHAPTEGDVLYDGFSLRDISYTAVRQRVGVVLQDVVLFRGSIRANIAFYNPTMGDAEIVRAARLACVHKDIMAMPMGYGTLISEGGTNISGGQRQRLAIARALAPQPVILLLDEATSNLDNVTERRIHDNLCNLGCTRIVIAHRLSTIRDADQILVLDMGHLVAVGRHEELMELSASYRSFNRLAADGARKAPTRL